MTSFYIKLKNDKVLGPFNIMEMRTIDPPPDTMIAQGAPETWKPAEEYDFNWSTLYNEFGLIANDDEDSKEETLRQRKNIVLKAKLHLNLMSSLYSDRMRGYGFDVTNDSNLTEYEKGYLIHALEDYCRSYCKRPFSPYEKGLIAKLNDSYHIGGLVARIKEELKEPNIIQILSPRLPREY